MSDSRTLSSMTRTARAAQASMSSGDSMDDPQFSRPAKPDRQFVEVRPLLPIEVVAVLDAIAMDEGTDRTKVVIRACQEFAAKQHRRATLITNASRGYPPIAECDSDQS
jgi:hypothetical protein